MTASSSGISEALRRGVALRRAVWLALAAAAFLAGALLVAPAASHAADPGEMAHGWTYQAWNELMSPFCPGLKLADCPSPQAAKLRAWIAKQEELGRSKKDVEAEVYAEYGDVVLSAPKASGFGLATYVIPAVVLLLGGAVVALFLRHQTRSARRSEGVHAVPVDPELERALDEEFEDSDPRSGV